LIAGKDNEKFFLVDNKEEFATDKYEYVGKSSQGYV